MLSARPARRIDVASPTPSTDPLTEIWYCVSALPLALAAGQLRSTPPTPDGLALIDRRADRRSGRDHGVRRRAPRTPADLVLGPHVERVAGAVGEAGERVRRPAGGLRGAAVGADLHAGDRAALVARVLVGDDGRAVGALGGGCRRLQRGPARDDRGRVAAHRAPVGIAVARPGPGTPARRRWRGSTTDTTWCRAHRHPDARVRAHLDLVLDDRIAVRVRRRPRQVDVAIAARRRPDRRDCRARAAGARDRTTATAPTARRR